MSYDYSEERPKLFTREGNSTLEEIRAIVARNLVKNHLFDVWSQAPEYVVWDPKIVQACLDRMVELGELEEALAPPERPDSEARTFKRPERHRDQSFPLPTAL